MDYHADSTAIIDPGARVGKGSRIWHWVHICSGASVGMNCSLGQNVFVGNKVDIGNNVKIQNNVSIYDNVTLKDDVFCGPSMVFTNVYNPRSAISRKDHYRNTIVNRGATLGANCTVVCGVTIGEYAFIGAGALVNRDVGDFALMVGVPAKQIGWMSRFGEQIELPLQGDGVAVCPHTGDIYRLENGICKVEIQAQLVSDKLGDNQVVEAHLGKSQPGDSSRAEMPFIDLAAQQQAILPKIEKSIHNVLKHGNYIMGPEIRQLEHQLAAYTGSKHCITCSSGTDALLMALMALDISPGDEVITVPYTWISTAEVVALLRAKPVFVDILPDTFNLDPDILEAAITTRTRAIMPVGIYGQCAEMSRINAIAQKHGIPVIEDAAQCFGATHNGIKACNQSIIGCTSFFPTKPLGCYGDGGAIFTMDDGLADKMCQIRIHGQRVKHQHPIVGINGRLDTIQAAILLEKFVLFPDECELREQIGKRYDELLSGIAGIQTPVIASGNTSVYAQYTILSQNRETLAQSLKVQGIPSVAYYTTPLHLQGAFACLGYKKGDFPVTEQVASQCLSLPMSAYLSLADQDKVAKAVAQTR